MATATLRSNATDRRPTLTLADGRYRGTRWYDIAGASSLEDCFFADGLPAFGTPWSANIHRATARVFTPEVQPGTNPLYVMRVEYGEDAAQPQPGVKKTTTFKPAATSETVDHDVTGTKKLTDDGRGVSKMLASVSFEVVEGFTDLPDLGPYVHLMSEPKVNAAPVTLRNFMNTGQDIPVGQGRLLYAPFGLFFENGVIGVRHRLLYASSWKHRKPVLAPDGSLTGIFDEFDLYEEADYSAAGL